MKKNCTLPASFAEGVQPSYGPGGCGDITVLLAGHSCSVECAAIWVAVFGTTSVQCQPGGVISAPTLKCLYNPCRLPIAFPEGVEGVEGSSCVEGRYIARGQRCQVQCSPGYQLSGTSADSNEYVCNSDRMVEASLRCVPSTPPRSFLYGRAECTNFRRASVNIAHLFLQNRVLSHRMLTWVST